MGTQNFDGFQPISENEEKQVVGGGGHGNPQCASLAQAIALIEQKIAAIQQTGGVVPPSLIQELQQTEAGYQTCMQQTSTTN